MPDSIEVSTMLPASPRQVYGAWLSGDDHGAFTGGEATVDPKQGGTFTAWDGYISGTNLELEPHKRIVQAWRTTDFPDDAQDSRLEVLLEEASGGTKLTLVHTDIPDGQGPDYEQGWTDFYFEPMKEFFAALNGGR
jgi:activator of HSP90 ATPase